MIRFNEPYVTGREEAYIKEVFKKRYFSGNGPFTNRCNNLLQQKFGARKVLVTHSCTAALEMSALLAGLKPGDEVVVPSYTFCTTASAMLRVGATVVFCEVNPATMMMDMADVARRVTNRTRAIVPVHYAGIAVDMDGLQQLVKGRDIIIIEDAAQAIDSAIDGKFLGTFGRFGCVSFHELKNIHAGLAGALFVNDEKDVTEAEYVWERGTNRQQLLDGKADKYTWVTLGSSFYPTELQAAMLLAQLEAIEHSRAHRSKIFAVYEEMLTPLEEAGRVSLPRYDARRRINFHAFFLVFNTHSEREHVRNELKSAGIEATFHYIPLHSSPMGQRMGYSAGDLPMTERLAYQLLRLPLHCEMSVNDAQAVAKSVISAITSFRGH